VKNTQVETKHDFFFAFLLAARASLEKDKSGQVMNSELGVTLHEPDALTPPTVW